MVNCNPETVSTDYDTSDRLYFEPLIEEYVQNIILKEKSKGNLIGVIAQFGGQTPIKLAKFLHENNLPILGTQYSSIDLAEDRERFRDLLMKLNLKQAESGIANKFDQAIKISEKIGLPVVVRPSYVLGGRAMEIVHDKSQLKKFINEAFKASEQNPILIDKFIDHAMEVEVDAISDGKDVYVAGIMQHIEEAGVHSGDSACCLPPVSIKDNLLKDIKVYFKTKKELDKYCKNENILHQGYVAEIEKLEDLNLKEFIKIKKHKTLLCLQGVTDPRNIGSIIRSALAFKIDGIIVKERHFPNESKLMYKAASGAIEYMNIFEVSNINSTLKNLKSKCNFLMRNLIQSME